MTHIAGHKEAELIRRGTAPSPAAISRQCSGSPSPAISWHVPGRSPLSGDYKRHDGVPDFFARCQELSGGTLQVVPDTILAHRHGYVVALTTVPAERHGQSWSSPDVHVWKAADGRAAEFVEYQGDGQTEDEFWLG